MESIDPQKAAQVWQRVQGREVRGLTPQVLQEMIVEEWTDKIIYQQLADRFSGKERTLLRQMGQQEQEHLICLQGIYVLLCDKPPNLGIQPPELGGTRQLLRRCYGREMRTIARYESFSEEPEYGGVFRQLIRQEWEHCRKLLQLLAK